MTLCTVAGSDGYDYLTNQVAVGDQRLQQGEHPADYYRRAGERPGFWAGAGAADRELTGPVDAATMKELWSTPHREAGRRSSVAGFDLIFSPVKSVSALWAVAPDAVRDRIAAAHEQAVLDTLRWIEQRVAAVKVGAAAAEQPAPYLTVAVFQHSTSRAGDPALHTHAAVYNRALSPDGQYRALHHRSLRRHVVTASERYNTRLEDYLHADLGLAFEDRARADPALRPTREVIGVPPELMREFSARRVAIERHVADLHADYSTRHGVDARRSVRVDARMHQWSTLATRPSRRAARSLADRVAAWRARATRVLGAGGIERMLAAVRAAARRLDPRALPDVARAVWARCLRDRPQPQRWHVAAETERQLRTHPAAVADRDQVVDQVMETVMAMSNPTQTDAQRRLAALADLGRRIREAKTPPREHLALTAAGDFYRAQATDSWVPTYMATRKLPADDVGYAPGHGRLVAHLRGLGFTDDELIRAGLAARTDRGHLRDWFTDRAVFPLRNESGQTVGFTGRRSPADTSGRYPKYLNSPGQSRSGADIFRKAEVVYGLTPAAVARLRGGGPVVFVEGPTDALAFDVSRETLRRQDGHRPALADAVVLGTCGTAMTAEHLTMLDRIAPLRDRAVYVVMDNDNAGVQAQLRAYNLLRGHGLTDLYTMALGSDPADALVGAGGPEFIAQVWSEFSVPLYDAPVAEVFRRWADPEHGFVWAEQKVAALREAAPLIAAMPEPHRARQIAAVVSELQMPAETVEVKVKSHVPVTERLGLPAAPVVAATRPAARLITPTMPPPQQSPGIGY